MSQTKFQPLIFSLAGVAVISCGALIGAALAGPSTRSALQSQDGESANTGILTRPSPSSSQIPSIAQHHEQQRQEDYSGFSPADRRVIASLEARRGRLVNERRELERKIEAASREIELGKAKG